MIKLVQITSNVTPKEACDDGTLPCNYDAIYIARTQEGRDTPKPGGLFWFDFKVSQTYEGFFPSCNLTVTRPLPDMKGALLKLAQWARMLAQAIEESEECSAPFPMELPNRK